MKIGACIVMWASFAWSLLMLVLIVTGFPALGEVAAFVPLTIGTVLFAGGYAAALLWREREWYGFAVMVAGAVILGAVGLHYMERFPITISSYGSESGYNSIWKLIYRHMFPVVTVAACAYIIVRKRRMLSKKETEAIIASIQKRDTPSVFTDEEKQ